MFYQLSESRTPCEFQRMYELGVRRLFFVGAGPLGCYPLLRQRSLAMECDAEASSLSARYSAAAAAVLRDMSSTRRRPGFRYSFFDLRPVHGAAGVHSGARSEW